MTLSPTQLTLRYLREQGYTAEVVEHWNPHVQRRQDLFGFIDVLGVRPGETIAVQTTSVGGVSHRLKKIADSPLIGAVREAGWTIHVHGWRKVGNRWQLARSVDVS
jgi:hypothetical protein